MMELPPEVQAGLLDRRVVFVRGRLDDQAVASGVIAQLLLVGRLADGKPIEVYLDSPGGALGVALSIYDVVRSLAAPVSTTCLGTAGGAAVLILAAGALGRRFALPHARIHLADDPVDVRAGRAPEVAGQAEQAARLRERWVAALANHVGHSAERIARDLAAGRWLGAAEARDYGLVDGIIPGAPAAGIGRA
jgi:ATP-dependent Clp protease protease subunit